MKADNGFGDLPLMEVNGMPWYVAVCFTFVSVMVVLAWAGAFK